MFPPKDLNCFVSIAMANSCRSDSAASGSGSSTCDEPSVDFTISLNQEAHVQHQFVRLEAATPLLGRIIERSTVVAVPPVAA
jgi:hypothetical protein